jgi:polysaccharide pyruvyl transferase WcaK-like protein
VERRGTLRPSMASLYAFARDIKNWAAGIWRGATGPDPRKIPYPNAYWLSPELPMRKATYAASIGYSDVRHIPRDMRQSMARHIRALDFISVRDQPTLNFLNVLNPDLGGKARQTPDPAWLFDQALPGVGEKLRSAGVPADMPVAGVLWPLSGGHGERLGRWVLPLLKKRGFHVVSIIDRNPAADTDLATQMLTPFEWWSAIRALDFLVTVRTHPNIAALQYGTPFFNVDITAMLNRSDHSKSQDMLTCFGLEDCCMYRRADFTKSDVCAGVCQALDRHWDWKAIAEQVERNRQQCRAVIAEMISVLTAP